VINGWLAETPRVFLPQAKEELKGLEVEVPNAVLQRKW